MGRSDVASASTEPIGVLEALLTAVIRTSDDAIFTCDAHGRITSWGTAAMRLFGLPETDALGRPLESLFPEHLRGEVRAVTSRVGAGDEIRRFETEVLRTDGMPMPVSLSMCPVYGASSALSLVNVRDVTEQVLAQATLAEVESRLREAEALAHIGSWMWDRRTGVVQWSDEFYRIHAVDPLEFGGTLEAYLAAIDRRDRARIRDAMEQSAASARAFEAEYRVANDVRVIRVRAEPTIGSAGTAVGLSGVGRDLSVQ